MDEAKFGKSPSKVGTTGTGGGGGGRGLGFGPGTSVLDFIKNIANVLVKSALVSLGTFGIAKLLENGDNRKTIGDFVKNLFLYKNKRK